MSKKALITGVAGNDGPYLTQLLIEKGYEVVGLVRQNSQRNFDFINEFKLEKMHVVEGDITDAVSMNNIIESEKPDEIYNLAAMSHPGLSYSQPGSTIQTTGVAVLNILEAIKHLSPSTKLCHISSSDIFANTTASPQTEDSPMVPNSPYGAAKILAHNLVDLYRREYGLFTCNAICYGHESPRRSGLFLVGKVSQYFRNYKNSDKPLVVGNLEAERDWGDTLSFVKGMNLMLQYKQPENFVFGTGKTHTVEELLNKYIQARGLEVNWIGAGSDRFCMNNLSQTLLVRSDPSFYRKKEEIKMVADSSKANRLLGWSNEMSLDEIVKWSLCGTR